MEEWHKILEDSITTGEELARHIEVVPGELDDAIERFPMRINAYWLNLMKAKGEPIARQVVPLKEEAEDAVCGEDDPLAEDADSPVPAIVHRYPDRVLFLVARQCPIYCRFCTRRRMVGLPEFPAHAEIEQGLDYIRAHPEIRDVILSGGDPLMLQDDELDRILQGLRAIPHVQIIRIHTRVPGALPQRITPALCDVLRRYHPLYMNLHFNHPDEITPEAERACALLADAGIPLGSQTVLLKGVNDDPEVMKRLMLELLRIRVRPYYLYQADLTRGTNHFRTPVEDGLEAIRAIRGFTSGLAVPQFVIDAPEGGGKVPVLPPEYLVEMNDDEVIVRNYDGQVARYPQASSDVRATAKETTP